MFDDDKIDPQSDYEQFHRTRLTPERSSCPRAGELHERTCSRNSWQPGEDRFEHLFERHDRLW